MEGDSNASGKGTANEALINGDAKVGERGKDGNPGDIGSSAGASGGSGTNATAGQRGADVEKITIVLSTTEVLSNPRDGSGERIPSALVHADRGGRFSSLFHQTYPLASVPPLQWSARGGRGGDGGHGGAGGAGARGLSGGDATADYPGADGKDGGNGGDGGLGANGGDGGNGGEVHIIASAVDAYLLASLPSEWADFAAGQTPLVAGGAGGHAGRHGTGGSGGAGGKGGKPFYKPKSEEILQRGGFDGRSGTMGRTPTYPTLRAGTDGRPGSFTFQIGNPAKPSSLSNYPTRFRIKAWNDFTLSTTQELAKDVFQFSDTITIRNISLKNVGNMPSPAHQRILIEQRPATGLLPLDTAHAYVPVGRSMQTNDVGKCKGELRFTIPTPQVRAMGRDVEPFEHSATVQLRAFQLGPEGDGGGTGGATSPFKVEYHQFHETPRKITLRYPIENTTGLSALRSLAPNERTVLSLRLFNSSSKLSFGSDSSLRRHVGVQFYRHPSQHSGSMVTAADYLFQSLDGTQTWDLEAGAQLSEAAPNSAAAPLYRGHLRNVSLLGPRKEVDVATTISFQSSMPLYSRLDIQSEILLQDLSSISQAPLNSSLSSRGGAPPPKHHNHGWDSQGQEISIVQRRTTEIVCEPHYSTVDNARVVLVTSTATTHEQYHAWTYTLDTMLLPYECFSMTRYGSLDPSWQMTPQGQSQEQPLGDLFRNKLVIVLNDPFYPAFHRHPDADADAETPIRPSSLLPHGCMGQSSGYHASTRWLIVGANDAITRELLQSHHSPSQVRREEHTKLKDFKKKLTEQLKTERENAMTNNDNKFVQEEVVEVHVKGGSLSPPSETSRSSALEKGADKLRAWLEQQDRLRQDVVEYDMLETPTKGEKQWHIGNLIVRRGFLRSLNTAVVVRRNPMVQETPLLNEKTMITCPPMLLAISEAMSLEMRANVFVDVVRESCHARRDAVLDALKDAFVTDLLRDVANVLDGKIKVISESDELLLFPSVGVFRGLASAHGLLQDCDANPTLRAVVSTEFSNLIGRFESVADCAGLPSGWNPFRGRSKVQEVLQGKMMEELKREWSPILRNDLVSDHLLLTQTRVKSYIRTRRKTRFPSVRSRWKRRALLHLHSGSNAQKYGAAGSSEKPAPLVSSRLLDLEEEGKDDKTVEWKRPSTLLLRHTESATIRGSIRERQEHALDLTTSTREMWVQWERLRREPVEEKEQKEDEFEAQKEYAEWIKRRSKGLDLEGLPWMQRGEEGWDDPKPVDMKGAGEEDDDFVEDDDNGMAYPMPYATHITRKTAYTAGSDDSSLFSIYSSKEDDRSNASVALLWCQGCESPMRPDRQEHYRSKESDDFVLCPDCFDDKHKSSQPMEHVIPSSLPKRKRRDGRGRADGGGLPSYENGKFTSTSQIKVSGQATVYRGVMKASSESGVDKDIAIKVFHRRQDWDKCKQELRALWGIPQHPNVIVVLDLFESPKPCLVMRYVAGGDLRDHLDKNGPLQKKQEALAVLRGIGQGLKHLHSHGVIHRDVKSPNVLLEGPDLRPVLIDLGLGKMSTTSASTDTSAMQGTIQWMAPEMIQKNIWSEKTDMFAVGVILWEVFTGKVPYLDVGTLPQVICFVLMQEGRPDRSALDGTPIPPALREMMEKLWSTNPEDRPTAEEFLKGVDSENETEEEDEGEEEDFRVEV